MFEIPDYLHAIIREVENHPDVMFDRYDPTPSAADHLLAHVILNGAEYQRMAEEARAKPKPPKPSHLPQRRADFTADELENMPVVLRAMLV